MTTSIGKYIARLAGADRQTRLETLLDLSRRLPELPERYREAASLESHRVPECQMPVHLWVEVTGGVVHLAAEVPRESPTVRGFVALLVLGLEGAAPSEVEALPDDLLHATGLDEALGMMRTQGLTAIVRRIKRGVRDSSARTPS